MTDRKPADITFESWVDRQIREAAERGAFDNLPGAGAPLPGLDSPRDENWWVRGYLRREGLSTEELLPTPLRLRKEIEQLPQTVRALHTEQAVRDTVDALNARIIEWLRNPSGPRVRVGRVNPDAIVEQWRRDTGRPAPDTAAATAVSSAGEPAAAPADFDGSDGAPDDAEASRTDMDGAASDAGSPSAARTMSWWRRLIRPGVAK